MKRSALDGSQQTNFIYLLPGLLLYTAFVFGPIVAALGLSLTSWDGLTMPRWVGLGNYADLFSDSRFYIALRNNAELMIFYCVLPLVLGITLAACVWNLKQREQLALRTFLFLPYIMPTAVLGIIWAWLYNPAFGPFNQFLRAIGLSRFALPWLGDFNFVLPAVGIVATWYFFGFCMVIFLTGIQRIDPSLAWSSSSPESSASTRLFSTPPRSTARRRERPFSG